MKGSYDVFNSEAFWTDVDKWIIRHNISVMDMANVLEVDPSWFRGNLRLRRSPSLRWAVLLAKKCDLSLDSYVL